SIDATNPYNPFGFTLSSGANGEPATYSLIARRFVEGGPRIFSLRMSTPSPCNRRSKAPSGSATRHGIGTSTACMAAMTRIRCSPAT
ncbi:MAG: hypothetical protein U5L74_08680, partial [Ideonella sp.]|nr:hypothetical protein [Ideonella sp.]